MKKIKHSKFKNTGILFELLVKQTTSDIMNSVDDPLSVKLIKKYFSKNKLLNKELELYKELVEIKFFDKNKASQFIDEVIKIRQKMNEKLLKKEKYNLIKEIKDKYDIDLFFRNKLNNYKILASIYQLFESSIDTVNYVSPFVSVNCRHMLIEHISNNKKIDYNDLFESYDSQDDGLKKLTYKIMVNKFNEKYKDLDIKQKDLLKEYIYSSSDVEKFKQYMDSLVENVKLELDSLISNVNDKSIQIKLNEVCRQIDNLKRTKIVKDNQIIQLMRYYELIKELKN